MERTKEEMVKYFEELSTKYRVMAAEEKLPYWSNLYTGKADAYGCAAYELEHNLILNSGGG